MFDLQTKHINLKTVGANNADGIRKLMTTLEKQFMDDPEFASPEEDKAPAANAGLTATTGTFGAGETKGTGNFGATSMRGSPTRGNEKGKKATT